ncbi:unnamed protein product [Lymnaea stagnalis]|uniref:UV-stimulated scaffold protein A C-terminal domain-containing protein n=1 Tax=Lymnaea stagnalis TaxID=6523 RepID=A0AAV2GZ37_LYMST
MDGFNVEIESELKKAAEKLNTETVKQMEKSLQELTTTGNPTLNEEEIKKFKRLCRHSDDYVRYAFFLIMKQLKRKHSEIRLSTFQVADELFNRSHAFREMLVNHLQHFLTLTTETEPNMPLPPPKAAANKLKAETLHAVQRWHDKFGQGYRKLALGYEYLKNCRHVDFNQMRAQNLADRLRIENEEKRKQKIMAGKLAKVLQEIEETKSEIENCAKEAENCLNLLLPSPTDFLIDFNDEQNDEKVAAQQGSTAQHREERIGGSDVSESKNDGGKNVKKSFNDKEGLNKSAPCDSISTAGEIQVSESSVCEELTEPRHVSSGHKCLPKGGIKNLDKEESVSAEEDEEDYDESEDLYAHGLTNHNFSLILEVPENVSVQETGDNTDVICTLKEASKLISSMYLPKVTRWLEILSKNGAAQADIKAAIEMKVHLEAIKDKCVELKLVSMKKEKLDDDDSDDDFEEVPEKEGYEARIPSHLRAEYGLSGPSTSNQQPTVDKNNPSHITYANGVKKFEKAFEKKSTWNLKEKIVKADIADPTSLAAALANVKSERSTTSAENKARAGGSNEVTTKELPDVPFVEFGTDLAFWENPDQMEAPSIIKFDSLHRFWATKEAETEKPSQHDLAALKNRVFTFAGKFEPVKWKCRAPLPSGKLCERMDRVKCPFHGKIIARDEQGRPNVTQIPENLCASIDETSSSAIKTTELPPWKDPELQREIEQATGHDLGSARSQKLLDKGKKGKGKGKGKKSNLTDINTSKNTTRKRLEDRVFNKRSLKRVCSTLDNTDYKRVRDKFGSQFQYSLH